MVPENLAAFFKENPRLALAFSGGVDSAYLLYAAYTLSFSLPLSGRTPGGWRSSWGRR